MKEKENKEILLQIQQDIMQKLSYKNQNIGFNKQQLNKKNCIENTNKSFVSQKSKIQENLRKSFVLENQKKDEEYLGKRKILF